MIPVMAIMIFLRISLLFSAIYFSQKTNVATVLEEDGPYTLFAPTNVAFALMKPDYLDYLKSEEVIY